jgi:hypothetical protein
MCSEPPAISIFDKIMNIKLRFIKNLQPRKNLLPLKNCQFSKRTRKEMVEKNLKNLRFL